MNLNTWVPKTPGEAAAVQEADLEVEIDEPIATTMPSNGSLPGACRVQSPSSILTHKQCPRKYYFRYIERLPGPKSIHLIRGSVIHQVLEDVYDVDFSRVPADSFFSTLKYLLQEMFTKEWTAASDQLAELHMDPDELDEFFQDSRLMVDNFYHYVYDMMLPELDSMNVHDVWNKLMPQRELKMASPQHLVRGFIDIVAKEGDKTIIIDYKTSKRYKMTPEYRLQLGIYAMMQEEVGKPADEVSILFLKHGRELRIPVDEQLVEEAKQACSEVQLHTRSTNQGDYPKRPSPLCKWKTGQCEYHDICFLGQSVPDYREAMKLKR